MPLNIFTGLAVNGGGIPVITGVVSRLFSFAKASAVVKSTMADWTAGQASRRSEKMGSGGKPLNAA